MGRLAVIADSPTVRGFGLVGALVLPADDADAARAAWAGLPEDVAVVILSATAAAALDDVPPARGRPLRVVLPG